MQGGQLAPYLVPDQNPDNSVLTLPVPGAPQPLQCDRVCVCVCWLPVRAEESGHKGNAGMEGQVLVVHSPRPALRKPLWDNIFYGFPGLQRDTASR